jgi:hypothetical protein
LLSPAACDHADVRTRDDLGRVLDAEFTVEIDAGQLAIVLASAGGPSGERPARNPDYRKALDVVLVRLRRLEAVLTEALVDSAETQRLAVPESDRRLLDAPVRLADISDIGLLVRRLTARQRTISQAPGSRGGNTSKRMRLRLIVPTFRAADAERLADHLAGADVGVAGTDDWTAAEISAIVSDYLEMLQLETRGGVYWKAEHRRALASKLRSRSTGSIEYKHQNISAAMIDLGLPYIRGYKPLGNYQAALAAEIQLRLETTPGLLAALRPHPGVPPAADTLKRTAPPAASSRRKHGRHVDYGELQEEARRRGELGERLVVDHERQQLRRQERADLADRVRWVARDDGDGLGYDVLSYRPDGHERHIEVKTTALGPETPFYISSAELDFAGRHASSYALYRVFAVLDQPQFFVLEGDLSAHIETTPATYRAWVTEQARGAAALVTRPET